VITPGHPLHYPTNTALHLAPHNGGSSHGGYPTQATPTSATRSTQVEDSDTNESDSDVDADNNLDDADLEPNGVDDGESGYKALRSHESRDKVYVKQPDALDDLKQSRGRVIERATEAVSAASSQGNEPEIAAETSTSIRPSEEASQERLLPELTLRHKLSVLRRVYAEGAEEDTLSPRMREVALDEPLMTTAQVGIVLQS
jgi:hypothetical protein